MPATQTVTPTRQANGLITVATLISLLIARKGNMFASVVIKTDADKKMNKGRGDNRNPYFGVGIHKVTESNIMVNFDYAAALERRSDGEESAANNGNTWQQRVIVDGKPTPLTTHKDDVVSFDGKDIVLNDNPRAYLACEFLKSKSQYVDAIGNPINGDLLKPWLKPRKPQTVQWATIALQSIESITMDGTTYRLQ